MKGKKGQLEFIKIIFVVLMFIIVFAFFLAPFVSTGLGASNLGVFSGVEGWVVGGLNVWIFFAFMIAVFVWIFYGMGE